MRRSVVHARQRTDSRLREPSELDVYGNAALHSLRTRARMNRSFTRSTVNRRPPDGLLSGQPTANGKVRFGSTVAGRRDHAVVSAPTADAPTATAIPGAAGAPVQPDTAAARRQGRPTLGGLAGFTPQPSRVRRSARGGLTSTYSAGDRWQKDDRSAAVAHAGSCRSLTLTGIKQSLDATIGAGLNGGSERCGRWTVGRMTVPGQRPLLSRSRERRVQRWPYSVNTKSLFFATL